MHLKMFAKWRPFCPGGDELTFLLMTWIYKESSHQQAWYRSRFSGTIHAQQRMDFSSHTRKWRMISEKIWKINNLRPCESSTYCVSRGPLHGFILNPAWISNNTHSNVCDENTYPFPNYNGCTIEVCLWLRNFIPYFIMDAITYPCWVSRWRTDNIALTDDDLNKLIAHFISHFQTRRPKR